MAGGMLFIAKDLAAGALFSRVSTMFTKGRTSQ
jgi:hypothetical protein